MKAEPKHLEMKLELSACADGIPTENTKSCNGLVKGPPQRGFRLELVSQRMENSGVLD